MIICILINIPSYFQLRIRHDYEFDYNNYDYDSLQNFEYCDKESFSKSLIGKVLLFGVFILRDLVTLLIEILLAYKSLRSYKFYLNQRTVVLNLHSTLSQNFNSTSYVERKNKNNNLTKMTLVLSLASIICHVFSFCLALTLLLYKNQAFLLFSCIFFILFKNSLNIFSFYFFNKNFKKSFRNMVNLVIKKLTFNSNDSN